MSSRGLNKKKNMSVELHVSLEFDNANLIVKSKSYGYEKLFGMVLSWMLRLHPEQVKRCFGEVRCLIQEDFNKARPKVRSGTIRELYDKNYKEYKYIHRRKNIWVDF